MRCGPAWCPGQRELLEEHRKRKQFKMENGSVRRFMERARAARARNVECETRKPVQFNPVQPIIASHVVSLGVWRRLFQPQSSLGNPGRAGSPATSDNPLGASRLGQPPPVRLRRQEYEAVEVRSCAVKNRAVSNRNCVAAMRGGEQRNENDQSVIQAVRVDRRSELDSVGVAGRAGRPKEACRGGPDSAGSRGEPRPTRRWLETEWPEGFCDNQGDPPVPGGAPGQQSAHLAGGSQSVRSSWEAGNDRGAKGRRKVEE